MGRVVAVTVAVLSLTIPALAQDATRVGVINLSYVTRSSKAGKSALAELEQFVKQKESEVVAKAAELESQQRELQKASTGLGPRALADLQKAFEKSRIDFTRFQEDAQTDITRMQQQVDADFRVKLAPIIDAVSKEKGLQFVFGLEQAAILWWSPAADISEDVLKRLDAGK